MLTLDSFFYCPTIFLLSNSTALLYSTIAGSILGVGGGVQLDGI